MSGGKGGSNQTVAYYYAPIAFAVCEGPIIGIKKIWAGGNLIFDDSQPAAVNTYQGGGKKSGPTVSTSYQQFSSSTQNDVQTGGSALGPWTCYLGTETQPADQTIGEGVGYRGMAYIVFNPLNIGPGATIPPLTFEVVTQGALNPPSVEFSYQPSAAAPAPYPTGTISDANIGMVFDDNGDVLIPCGNAPFGPPGYPAFLKCSNSAPEVIGIGGPVNYPAFLYPIKIPGAIIGFAGINSGGGDHYWVASADTLSGMVTGKSLMYPAQPGGPVDGNYQTGYDGQYLWFLFWGAFSVYNASNFGLIGGGDGPGYPSQPYDLVNTTTPVFTNGFLNGYMFVGGSGILGKYSAATGGYEALPINASACISDGSNLWVSYLDANSNPRLGYVDENGNILSSFPAVQVFSNLLLQSGFIWGNSGGSLYKYSSSGTLMHTLAVPNGSGYMLFDGVSIWTNNGYLTKISPGDTTIIAGTMDLPAAVTILCERAGLTQFDVSQLPATPVNFVRGDTVTARSMLQRLGQAYFFSMVDSGGILKFIPQGQPSQAVIPLEDLGYGKVSANAQTPFTSTRISGVDLPRSVKIRYYSAALNYDHYEQIFALESYDSGKEITLDLPLILDDQTAYNIAALACTLPHVEREQYAFTTSYKWLALEPADVVTLPFGVCRILTVKMGQKNGIPVIDFTACIDGMNALAGAGYARPALPNYQPNTGGIPALLAAPSNLSTVQTPGSASPHPIATAPQVQQTVPNAGVPKMVLTEPPPLRSTDTGMRFYVGAYSSGNTFPGAAIFESSDGGDTYTQLTTEIGATSAGYANTVLGPPNATQGFYTWDTQNTVDIYMLGNGSDPAPMTDLQVMNGANGAMLGQELIQFAQATLMTDSFGNAFYRLSRLLRGRRGTQWAMGTHVVGESFYPIPSALSKESYTPPMLNNAYLYKVVMAGGDLGNAPAISYEPNGNSLLQWSVCHPLVSVDGAGDWTVTWTPRARYNGDWASGYIPTLDPDTAGWSIDVLSGTTVKRTINVPLQTTAPWQTIYTAAMQSADGFTPGQAGITFNIYSLSSQVGRGTVRSITTP